MSTNRLLMPTAWLIVTVCLAAASAIGADADYFEQKVRPVLVGNCLGCHGKAGVGGLHLDSLAGMLKGGPSGPAIVPGRPEESLLIKAVLQEGELKMPKGNKLKPAEVAVLTEWIKQGAKWPETTAPVTTSKSEITSEQRAFWSFQPLKVTAPPQVKNSKWVRSPIDRYILAKLEEEKITPVPEADRRTYIRRATYDLTGLPPTNEEVKAFEADKSHDAYEKLVDRLLVSPAYGERWGRHWMDVTRYGEDDMHGLSKTMNEFYDNAYQYRDWVIKSFNHDVPFDRFLKAHLAGDLMDEKTRPQTLPGLGFLGQGPWFYDNGDPLVARADERHERVDTVTKAMLGLTVGCARCHDHKYDPITQRDYYALTGVFLNTQYHEYPLVPKNVADKWQAEDKKIESVEKLLSKFNKDAESNLAEALAYRTADYMMAAWAVTGDLQKSLPDAAADAKLDEELLQRWVAFLAKPPIFYPYLKPWQALIAAKGTESAARNLANEFQTLLTETMIEKGEIEERNNKIIAKGMPLDEKPSILLPNKFKSFFDRPQFDLGTLPIEQLNLWTDVFSRDMSETSDADETRGKPGLLVFRGYALERQMPVSWVAHGKALKAEIDERRKKLPKYPFIHGVEDQETRIESHILLRGSPFSVGDTTPIRFVEVLSPQEPKAFTQGAGRLELAEAIVNTPLAARVLTNRVWNWHYGTGIVNTPNNFGVAGERPTHPELLDYLAQRLVDQKWSLKALHKEIMLSATYRLSSTFDQASAAKDPKNRMHWRFSRQRLDAEEIRDSMLATAGTLEPSLGGPSELLTDAKNLKRTVYSKVSRFSLDKYLEVFDFPTPTLSNEARLPTNVPLQRLFFLNSDFVYDRAKELSGKVFSVAGDDNKVKELYRILFQREPTAAESEAGLKFLAQQRDAPATLAADTNGAGGLAAKPAASASGIGGPAKELKESKTDPWALYIRILLSSNEFLYLE